VVTKKEFPCSIDNKATHKNLNLQEFNSLLNLTGEVKKMLSPQLKTKEDVDLVGLSLLLPLLNLTGPLLLANFKTSPNNKLPVVLPILSIVVDMEDVVEVLPKSLSKVLLTKVVLLQNGPILMFPTKEMMLNVDSIKQLPLQLPNSSHLLTSHKTHTKD